jgi:DNA repair protein RecO (recombination protein O)
MNDRLTAPSFAERPPAPKPGRPNPADADRAFVLHTYPYLETSLIVEAFTATHGRVVLVAKGAKRPHAAMRGMLNPFQALRLNWFGRSEMKTLKAAEQERILPQLSGAGLLSAFYLNELLLKLTHREDPHEDLFDAYADAVYALTELPSGNKGVRAIATILRQFEVNLLRELGYALQLEEEADSHRPLDPDRTYVYQTERGPVACVAQHAANEPAPQTYNDDGLRLSGKTLLDMSANNYVDPQTQIQAKQLMRKIINHLLGDKILHTRQLMRDLR